MGRQIRSSQDAENFLMPILEKVINYVVQKILSDNQELIEQMIYDSYSPIEYERTGQFKEAWEADSKRIRNYAEGEMKFDSRELVVDYDNWQHGSKYLQEPMTTYLAEIIYQGLSGDMFGTGAWTNKRNVWEALIKKIGIRKIKEYFEEGMRANGLEYRGHTAAVKVTKYEEK